MLAFCSHACYFPRLFLFLFLFPSCSLIRSSLPYSFSPCSFSPCSFSRFPLSCPYQISPLRSCCRSNPVLPCDEGVFQGGAGVGCSLLSRVFQGGDGVGYSFLSRSCPMAGLPSAQYTPLSHQARQKPHRHTQCDPWQTLLRRSLLLSLA